MVPEMPSVLIERQPAERFISKFIRKTDEMTFRAKRTWVIDDAIKMYPLFAAKLQTLDLAITAQLKGRTNTEELNVEVGTVARGNSGESYVTEAVLLDFSRDRVYHHTAERGRYPHTNVYTTIFEEVHILEERYRRHGSNSPTDVDTVSKYRLIGQNHLPQRYMEEILRKTQSLLP